MIDFHSHSLLSDGVLLPAELVRRAFVNGYKVLGITDHADFSNINFVFDSMQKFLETIKECGWDIKVIPGIEITHVPAIKIEKIVSLARDMKIPLVIVHGETTVEPVEKGTNNAAIEACVDILAHPGLITEEEVKLAVKNNVSLEITARKGHSITNGHVAKLAASFDAPMTLDTDSHAPSDLFTESFRKVVLKGAGLTDTDILKVENNIKKVADRILAKMR